MECSTCQELAREAHREVFHVPPQGKTESRKGSRGSRTKRAYPWFENASIIRVNKLDFAFTACTFRVLLVLCCIAPHKLLKPAIESWLAFESLSGTKPRSGIQYAPQSSHFSHIIAVYCPVRSCTLSVACNAIDFRSRNNAPF
jgi:hypothetical protein